MIIRPNTLHLINGQDLGHPRNWEDLTITVDWVNDNEGATVNIADLEFVLEANRFLQTRILNGLSGGVGIFEGEPYTIKVGDPNEPVYTFEGYLDFTDEATVFGREEISVGLKKRKGNDWLNDVADGFSFAYLQDQGVISSGDFTKVPYVINYVPDGTQVILLSLSLYLMTKELLENARKVGEGIADLVKASTPVDVVGTSVGIGAGVVTAKDVGFVVLRIAALAFQVAYLIAIVLAIKNLITEIFNQLLPPLRNHLGMTFRRMFERACQYLGLSFQSTISQLDWVHVPAKDKKGGSRGETGVPSNSGNIYTFGDLIRRLKEMFNADYRIENGVFIFERRDRFEFVGPYEIPAFFNDQERLLDFNGFNTDEIVANYNIAWQFDAQDQNTLDDQTGRVFQAITTPINTINQDYVNIKGLTEIQLPFSIGRTKTELTLVEEIARDLGKFVDKLTGILGGGTNFQAKVERRVGAMLLSSDFLSFGRVVAMQGSRLARDQREILSANNLWFNFHFINSFAEVNGEHNQYFRYQGLRVPMSLEDFDKVLRNNFCTDAEGNPAELETVEYNPTQGAAVIAYRVKKKYTNNLKIQYV